MLSQLILPYKKEDPVLQNLLVPHKKQGFLKMWKFMFFKLIFNKEAGQKQNVYVDGIWPQSSNFLPRTKWSIPNAFSDQQHVHTYATISYIRYFKTL